MKRGFFGPSLLQNPAFNWIKSMLNPTPHGIELHIPDTLKTPELIHQITSFEMRCVRCQTWHYPFRDRKGGGPSLDCRLNYGNPAIYYSGTCPTPAVVGGNDSCMRSGQSQLEVRLIKGYYGMLEPGASRSLAAQFDVVAYAPKNEFKDEIKIINDYRLHPRAVYYTEKPPEDNGFWLYWLLCQMAEKELEELDESSESGIDKPVSYGIYPGMTGSFDTRMGNHFNGKGSKFTQANQPIEVLYKIFLPLETFPDIATAAMYTLRIEEFAHALCAGISVDAYREFLASNPSAREIMWYSLAHCKKVRNNKIISITDGLVY